MSESEEVRSQLIPDMHLNGNTTEDYHRGKSIAGRFAPKNCRSAA